MLFAMGAVTFLRLMVLPVDLQFDRAQRVFVSFVDPELLFALMFFAVLAGLLFYFRKRLTSLMWFFVLEHRGLAAPA